jgi:hypothetical protein
LTAIHLFKPFPWLNKFSDPFANNFFEKTFNRGYDFITVCNKNLQ